MRVTVEVNDAFNTDEVLIRCNKRTYKIDKLESYIQSLNQISIAFYKDDMEYFLDLNLILFFETTENSIRAHTIDDVYKVNFRLYELEEQLPSYFLRISKSTIVNINHIYAIEKNITSSSLIKFQKTHKQVYVSRLYQKVLKEKMKERRYK